MYSNVSANLKCHVNNLKQLRIIKKVQDERKNHKKSNMFVVRFQSLIIFYQNSFFT